MRILIANHQFFPAFYTGTERFSLNLARQLQRMGHLAEVVTYDMDAGRAPEDDGTGPMTLRRYGYDGVGVTAVRHRRWHGRYNAQVFDADTCRFFVDHLSRNPVDLVHVAHPMRIGAVVDAARELDIPTVLTLTDFWGICPRATLRKQNRHLCASPNRGIACTDVCFPKGQLDFLMQRYREARAMLEKMDAVCAPSRFLIHMFHHAGTPIPIRLVRHGLDYAALSPPEKPLDREPSSVTFGFIGTVLKHKGVDVLMDAFAKVDAPNIRLKIYGGGFHEQDFYRDIEARAGRDPRVEMVGEYRHEDLGAIIGGIDCVVVPSVWWENSPLTILNSLACRTPAIASNIGGMREFIRDGENGFTFAVGDADDLARLIGGIASEPSVLADMAARIQPPPRIEDEAFQYEAIYREIVRQRPSPRPAARVPSAAARVSGNGDRPKKPVFIIGSERSGTSIVASALINGARLPGYPEGHFLPLLSILMASVDEYYETRRDLMANERLMIAHLDGGRVARGILETFRRLGDSLFEDSRWVDKTPGEPMISAAPYLVQAWPEARFLFLRRRGIENMISRMKKFPSHSFEAHCILWKTCMEKWLSVKPLLPGKYLEVDQRDIALQPGRVGREIGVFLDLDAVQIERVTGMFSSSRPESTGSVETARAMDLNDTEWTAEEKAIFKKHCLPVFEAYGYSETAAYYRAAGGLP